MKNTPNIILDFKKLFSRSNHYSNKQVLFKPNFESKSHKIIAINQAFKMQCNVMIVVRG